MYGEPRHDWSLQAPLFLREGNVGRGGQEVVGLCMESVQCMAFSREDGVWRVMLLVGSLGHAL